MNKEHKKRKFLPKAHYPGGPRAMSKFVDKHLTYPELALEKRLEGVVRLRLDINYKGKVQGSKVLSSLGSGCDEEAQRVVSLLKFEVDREMRRGKILFHKTVNVRFNLPKPKKTTIHYEVVPKKDKKTDTSSASYHYTITI